VIPERALLHRDARALIEAGAGTEDWSTFGARVLQFQYANNPHVRRLCDARGLNAASLTLANAPAVPTDVFKLARCFSGDALEITRSFRTSGTTLSGQRGAHHFADVETYRLGALAFGTQMLLRDKERVVWSLHPAEVHARESSLAFMISSFLQQCSVEGAQTFFEGDLDQGKILLDELEASRSARPVLLMATSFALVHLLDACTARGVARLELPPDSLVMQTGGFKGRSREVSASELAKALAALFVLPEAAMVSEYGMTELSSQFYAVGSNVFQEPPWASVLPVDPVTLLPVPDGHVGVARIVDLLNIDSACVLLTHDQVRRTGAGFELLGRLPSAEARGCSIAMDELLLRGAR
jgi:hypothetical protein